MNKITPSIIAIYLPQFHETEFNNKHWEKGYTEWVACKRAKPLFAGHNQPREPLNEHYYDLSDIREIERQGEMAKKYGVDGFAVYHYYSCGKKLLNKPMEMLLEHPEVDFPYYFFWANESWKKNWFGQNKEVVWPQEYGQEREWEQHYEYCRAFFKDKRYIRKDNCPVFFIYQPWLFDRINGFIRLWNNLAINDGFDGIYFVKNVTARTSSELGGFNAVFERQPFYELGKGEHFLPKYYRLLTSRMWEYTNRKGWTEHILWKRDYNGACDNIVKMPPSAGSNTILGVFSGWDNTPRKGFSGCLFTGESPESFEKCLDGQIKKAIDNQCPQIVINAWNEWAEGMYIEPDEVNKFKYLEAVSSARKKNGI